VDASTPTPAPAPTPAPTGNIYYVAKTGNDNNPGTESLPWLTITKATNTLVAGDKVYVKRGVYNEQVWIRNSGASGKPITYAAYPGDENKAIIDGTGIDVYYFSTGIVQVDASYINIKGFRMQNSNGNLLHASGGIGNLLVYNNQFYNAAAYCAYVSGTTSGGYNTYNIIFDTNDMSLCSNGRFTEGFTIKGVNGFEIKNTVFHDSGNGEGYPYTGGEGIDIFNSANGAVHNNIVYNTKYVGLYLDSGGGLNQNIKVYNNLVYDVRNGPSMMIAAELTGGVADSIYVYNNIVYDADTASFALSGENVPIYRNIYLDGNTFMGGYGLSIEGGAVSNIILRNTITVSISDSKGIIKDHNWQTDTQGSPGFIDEAGHNYRLTSNAAVKDIGSPYGAPAFDYDGNPRPDGVGYSIGAFE
jgi:hypothetical protein